MINDLSRLAENLEGSAPDIRLKKRLEAERSQIKEALEKNGEYKMEWEGNIVTIKKIPEPVLKMEIPNWFGPALAIAKHQDQKASWPWYGRFFHWAFRSWRCGCCIEERKRR